MVLECLNQNSMLLKMVSVFGELLYQLPVASCPFFNWQRATGYSANIH